MRELCGAGDSVGCRELVARELCGAGDSVGCRARLYVVFVNDSLCIDWCQTLDVLCEVVRGRRQRWVPRTIDVQGR